MVIDTKEIAARVKLGSMLVVLVLVALSVLDFIYVWVPDHILEYICLGVFILFEAYLFIKKFNYINYNSDGFKIILKYTSLGLLSAGNFKLEIPKKDFVKVELRKSWLGMKKKIIIYVKTPNGIAKFRPISVSLLSAKERMDMVSDLESLKR